MSSILSNPGIKEKIEKILYDKKPYLLYDAEDNRKIEGILISNTKDSETNVIHKNDLNYLLETIDFLEFKLNKFSNYSKDLENYIENSNIDQSHKEEIKNIIFDMLPF